MTSSVLPVASKTRSSRSREEAHWYSFRGEVLQLQQTLVESVLDNDGNRDKLNIGKGSNSVLYGDRGDSTTKISGKQFEASAHENDIILLPHDVHKENKIPLSQIQLSPLEELDDSAEIIEDENNDNTTQSSHHHHYLELIGMEEVDRSICSVNNKNNLSSHDNNIPTNNAMSHASQNTNALSIATQELAEMKLKLALTESERDELEFELMQSKYSNDGA